MLGIESGTAYAVARRYCGRTVQEQVKDSLFESRRRNGSDCHPNREHIAERIFLQLNQELKLSLEVPIQQNSTPVKTDRFQLATWLRLQNVVI